MPDPCTAVEGAPASRRGGGGARGGPRTTGRGARRRLGGRRCWRRRLGRLGRALRRAASRELVQLAGVERRAGAEDALERENVERAGVARPAAAAQGADRVGEVGLLGSIANNTELDVIWDKWQSTLEPLIPASPTPDGSVPSAQPAKRPSELPRAGIIPAVGSPDGCRALSLTDGTGPSRVTEAGIRP